MLGAVSLILLYSGDDRPSVLDQVEQRGSLTVLTRNGASSYYLGADGPTGPEYELARAFSEYLGVNLELKVADAFSHLAQDLTAGRGDLIAANLSRTRRREFQFNFGPDYLETEILAVTRRRGANIGSLADLAGRSVMVIGGSSYEEALQQAREQVPGLTWEARDDVGIEDLLQAVSDGAVDATLIDSTIFRINRSFYPRLRIAFTLPGSVPHAWAFAPGPDDSLAQKARAFFLQVREDGRLAEVLDRFYVDVERLGQFDMFHFLERVRDRLPLLIEAFREAGEVYDMDWRLLAAVGYQESQWDPEASSYTGVRGIMMLTEQTAKQLGVADRLDPDQSIDGGARYLRRLHDRLPDRIADADRMWMALAAYNLGMGHLRDARRLTQKRGFDPDRWADVRQSLDLLSQEKWHSQTRHGYARGFEAKQFVANIQRYFEILTWMDTREHPLLVTQRHSAPDVFFTSEAYGAAPRRQTDASAPPEESGAP
ncbi:membrane-bound lytic murein transglycosylase MltF [Elongatibacter sediminis]|uniref:Membrane-bound lytic murein transglycosylase F n=1 Tax=Elongatibacter sediminis TaxID=3119006 RepID=A0AAW9R8E4_9GAMM